MMMVGVYRKILNLRKANVKTFEHFRQISCNIWLTRMRMLGILAGTVERLWMDVTSKI